MHFRLLDAATLPGHTINEDRYGLSGDIAWIIDGATDVLKTRILPGPSDAAWYTETLTNALAKQVIRGGLELDTLVAATLCDVRSAFNQHALRAPLHRHEWPAAAGVFVKVNRQQLEVLSLGDCSAFMLKRNGRVIDLFPENRIAAKRESDDVATCLQRHSKLHPAELRERVLEELRKSRDEKPVDVKVLCLDGLPRGASPQSVPLSAGDRIILASDGAMRYVDLFAASSLKAFIDALQSKGVREMLAAVRAVESRDPFCKIYPRFKRSDDATIMVLSFDS